MKDKIGYGVGIVAMIACCGLPLLIISLSGTGLIAWLTDNAFSGIALILIAGAVYLYYRGRKKRPRVDLPREMSGRHLDHL